jgi:5,10-methylenetetrahydromethanopterin reductase
VPGGVFLGLGTGDSGVTNLGLRPAPLEHLRAYLLCIRELLESGTSRWDGNRVFLAMAAGTRVPIYVSAHGPRSIELGAEIGDGIVVGTGFSRDVTDRVHEIVERTCERTGQDPASLDLRWAAGGIGIEEDSSLAVAKIGWLVASSAHHASRHGPRSGMLPDKLRNKIMTLGDSYDLRTHGRQPAEHKRRYVQLATDLGVWGYMADRFLIAGTEAEVSARLAEFTTRGVRKLQVSTSVCGMTGIERILTLVTSCPESKRTKL